MFFDSRTALARVLAVGVPAYLVLVVLLRVSGKRIERERVLEAEVLQALRAQGVPSLEAAHAVVLETDGTFSVVPAAPPGNGSALANVGRGGG